MSKRVCLRGDVEVDEHSVRSFHVCVRNPLYQQFVTACLAKKKCSYYLNYVRVIGMRQRGNGPERLKFLPPHLLSPQSKPPPISSKELKESRI